MDLKCVSARGRVSDSEWELDGLTRTGPPPGGPVRSVRERTGVLPSSGPKDLRSGKNGYVQIVGCYWMEQYVLDQGSDLNKLDST